jgi:hypothetical protein
MKNGFFWDVKPCGSCRNHVSEELSASIIRVTRICELGTLAVASSRRVNNLNSILASFFTLYFFSACVGC